MKSLAIIPARFASSRFPGKPLVNLGGKPMLRWVWEHTKAATLIDEVIIATDHPEIYQAAISWGAKVEMTDEQHASGTDRCAEVAGRHLGFDFVVNVQGDEPFLNPADIDILMNYLKSEEASSIATLCVGIQELEEIENPNVVKVVKSGTRAQYFSRAAIPFNREGKGEITSMGYYQHIGIYGFDLQTLLAVSKLPEGEWERIEKLEQLRWLEQGYSIGVLEVEEKTMGIDTLEDLEKAEEYLREKE